MRHAPQTKVEDTLNTQAVTPTLTCHLISVWICLDKTGHSKVSSSLCMIYALRFIFAARSINLDCPLRNCNSSATVSASVSSFTAHRRLYCTISLPFSEPAV